MTLYNKRDTRVSEFAKRRKQANAAIRRMRLWHDKKWTQCPAHKTPFKGMCLHAVACAYGLPAANYRDVIEMWDDIPKKYRHRGTNPPRGALVVFLDDNPNDSYNVHGHVTISTGRGKAWGVDRPVDGRVGRTPVSDPSDYWGMRYGGWVWPWRVPKWSSL